VWRRRARRLETGVWRQEGREFFGSHKERFSLRGPTLCDNCGEKKFLRMTAEARA
jgi:hypothetical protein